MQTITTKFIGATNYRGERIKATSESGISATVDYDYSGRAIDCHWEAVKALCEKLDWEGNFIAGNTKNGYVWVFDCHHSEKRTYSKR